MDNFGVVVRGRGRCCSLSPRAQTGFPKSHSWSVEVWGVHVRWGGWGPASSSPWQCVFAIRSHTRRLSHRGKRAGLAPCSALGPWHLAAALPPTRTPRPRMDRDGGPQESQPRVPGLQVSNLLPVRGNLSECLDACLPAVTSRSLPAGSASFYCAPTMCQGPGTQRKITTHHAPVDTQGQVNKTNARDTHIKPFPGGWQPKV